MGPDTLSIPQLLCFLGAFFVLRKFKCNPIAVMVVCGISGLLDFYRIINGDDPDEKAEMREWARGLGWTGRMSKPEKMV